MTRLARLATPAWIAGLSIAATGVAAARWVTPAFDPAWQPVVRLAGELLALAGLLVIAFGISGVCIAVPPPEEIRIKHFWTFAHHELPSLL